MKSLFDSDKGYTYTNEANEIEVEIIKAIGPILDKYYKQYNPFEVEYVVISLVIERTLGHLLFLRDNIRKKKEEGNKCQK